MKRPVVASSLPLRSQEIWPEVDGEVDEGSGSRQGRIVLAPAGRDWFEGTSCSRGGVMESSEEVTCRGEIERGMIKFVLCLRSGDYFGLNKLPEKSLTCRYTRLVTDPATLSAEHT